MFGEGEFYKRGAGAPLRLPKRFFVSSTQGERIGEGEEILERGEVPSSFLPLPFYQREGDTGDRISYPARAAGGNRFIGRGRVGESKVKA